MSGHLGSVSACCFGIAFLLYLVSGLMYVVNLFTRGMDWTRPAGGLAWAGFASHTAALVLRSVAQHGPPFINLLQGSSFLAWTIIGLFLILNWRYGLAQLGSFALPLGFAAIFLGAVLPDQSHSLVPTLRSNALYIHIGLSMLGYGSFALAFAAAVAYLVQESRLKRKSFVGTVGKLLSLEQADLLANGLVALGFALLTFGLILGGIAARSVWTGLWLLDLKVVVSVATWAVYALYLYARSVAGWRGHKTMVLLVWGFAFVLAGMVGVNLAGVSQHSTYSF